MAEWSAAIYGTLTGDNTGVDTAAEIAALLKSGLPAGTYSAILSRSPKTLDLLTEEPAAAAVETFSVALQGRIDDPDESAVSAARSTAVTELTAELGSPPQFFEEIQRRQQIILARQTTAALHAVKDEIVALLVQFDHEHSEGSFGEMFSPLVT